MSAPSTRPGPLIALGLAAAVAIAAVVVALVGGDDVSPDAVRVNGTRTTSATLDGELDGFSEGEYFRALYAQQGLALSESRGSISSRGTVQWLSYRTQAQLAERLLDRAGAPLSDANVQAAQRALARQGVTDGMSGSAPEQLARFSASAESLVEELGSYDDYRAAMRRAARNATIDVDPKYGRWDARRLAFCVPEGCGQGGQSVVPPAQSQSGG